MRSLRLTIAAVIIALAGVAAWANSFTPNKSFNLPTPQSDSNTWGSLLNVDISLLDTMLGGTASIPLTAPTTTATAAQAQNLVQKLTGALTGNTVYQLPQGLGGFWIVNNQTSGGFTVTVTTSAIGSTGLSVAPATPTMVYSDGTNVNLVSAQGASPALVPTGTILYFAGGTAPSGYLMGDGSCQSSTTYPALAAVAGTSFGSSCAGGQFTMPDCRGRMLAGYDPGNATGRMTLATTQGVSAAAVGNSGGEQAHTLVQAELPAVAPTATSTSRATSTVTDPGHSHPAPSEQFLVGSSSSGAGVTGGSSPPSAVGFESSTGSATTGITVSTSVSTTTTVGNLGSGAAHNVINPTLVANCIVKTERDPLPGDAAGMLAANDAGPPRWMRDEREAA